MGRKIVLLLLVLVLAFTLPFSLAAHSEEDFYVEITENNLRLYAYNYGGEEVDSYTIRAKIFDCYDNLLETENYSGDDFTTLVINLEQPSGWCFASARMTIRMMDGTVYVIDSYFD